MTTVSPPNDADILDSEELFRRIHPSWWIWDDKIGGHRLSSQAFENSRDGSGTSVVLSSESSREQVLDGHQGYGLAVLTAGSARAAEQGVRRVPIENVPGHAQIEGRKSGPIKNKLVVASEMVATPSHGPQG